jgi:hypothetical protein
MITVEQIFQPNPSSSGNVLLEAQKPQTHPRRSDVVFAYQGKHAQKPTEPPLGAPFGDAVTPTPPTICVSCAITSPQDDRCRHRRTRFLGIASTGASASFGRAVWGKGCSLRQITRKRMQTANKTSINLCNQSDSLVSGIQFTEIPVPQRKQK